MISTGLHTEQLKPEEKNWFAIAICEAIISDGNVAPEELLYLEKALSFLPSTENVTALIQAVKDHKLPEIGPLKNASRDTQVRMLFELVMVISSDNTLSTREMDFIFKVGKKLGYEKEFVQIAMRWANEGISWRSKLKHMIAIGRDLEPEY